VGINPDDEGFPDSNDSGLPFRRGGMSHPARIEARAEVRDRETYYSDLRYAVYCQRRSAPGTWDEVAVRINDTWT
jgi:hypothetical protein